MKRTGRFGRALSARLPALLLLAATAAACGGEESLDLSRFTADVCTGGKYLPLQRINPAPGIDGLGLRSSDPFGGGSVVDVDRWGAPCSKAADAAACKVQFDVVPDGGWNSGGYDIVSRHWLAATAGDKVTLYTTVDTAKTVLGAIDTPEEAAFLVVEGKNHRLECGNNAHAVGDGSFEILTKTGSGCGAGDDVVRHVMKVTADGAVSETESEVVKKGDPNCVIGRRTDGVTLDEGSSQEDLGAFFARMATLEAAAVPAFERMARELSAHGAPAALVEAALRSAREEVRHAASVTLLARRFGREPAPIEVGPMPVRSLEEIALENATEGCVRETFGALVATRQAARATDPQIAKMMRGIARDETRHAQLSWALAEWLDARLDDDARARVERAMDEAIARLGHDLETPVCAEAIALAGFPDPSAARALYAELGPRLWAA